jgi:RNA polymerase sigma-70 factor (ECF subfamily)
MPSKTTPWPGLSRRRSARRQRPVYDLAVTVERPVAEAADRHLAAADSASRRWVEQLHAGHGRHEQAVASLHDLLRRAALHELRRRSASLPGLSGPEFEDVAQQCADDALVSILARIDDFKGLSRFTTWAYKFAIFEVSSKLARHAWQRQPPSREDLELGAMPDSLTPRPSDQAERREQFVALKRAIDADLTPRQREVFAAVALNDVPIDVLALELGSNRNALYKNLFDARRKLRDSLAAAGYPLTDEEKRT